MKSSSKSRPRPPAPAMAPRATLLSEQGSPAQHDPGEVVHPEFLLYVGAFLLLAFLKTPVLFLNPRFWAEEGTVFFSTFRNLSLLDALQFTYSGNFLGLTNIAVYLSTLAPLAHAPVVTTYLALLFHAAVVAQIAMLASAYRLSRAAGLLLVAAWTLVPQSYEVWLSATNLQWVAGVSMLFVFAMPEEWLSRRAVLITVWASVCGLAGIPGVLVTPFFFLRALEEKSRTLLAIGLAGAACALVHLLSLYVHSSSGRQYPSDPAVLVLPAVLQSVIAPLFTAEFANGLAQAIRRRLPGVDGAMFGTLVLAAAIIRTAVASSSRSVAASLTAYVAGLWVLVSLIQTFGSLGDPRDMISGLGGARYFLFGSMALCLLLAWGTGSSDQSLARQAFAMLIVVAITGVVQRYTSPSIDFMTSGPSFRDQVHACEAAAKPSCRVYLWPRSASWVIDLKADP